MDPSQTKTINGVLIQQYYWNGRYVVYVDHRLVDRSFADACADAEASARKGGE